MIWILGENGRLANAIYEEFESESPLKIGRKDYLSWLDLSREELESYFKLNLPSQSTLFITSGIVDRGTAPEEIDQINRLLPIKILEACRNLDLRTVTVGSISEHFNLLDDAYIRSKRELSSYVQNHAGNQRNLHVRMHTLYGGTTFPHLNMFLGKVFESIQTHSEFRMSSGQQLREYHHINDVARAMRSRLNKDCFGVWDLNTGKPIKLLNLAQAIFLSFDLPELVTISREKDLEGDNLTRVFPETLNGLDVEFREPIQGVISYLKSMDRNFR